MMKNRIVELRRVSAQLQQELDSLSGTESDALHLYLALSLAGGLKRRLEWVLRDVLAGGIVAAELLPDDPQHLERLGA